MAPASLLDPGFVIGFALILLRVTSFFVTAPVISAHSVPMRARLTLAIVVTFVAFAAAGTPAAQLSSSSSWGALFYAAFANIVLGLAGGAGARAALEAAGAAGNIAGLGLGLGFASFFDPNAGGTSNALGELLLTLALGAAVALGVHREAIAWIVSGVITAPDASAFPMSELCAQACVQMIGSAALGVRLAFPFLVVGVVAQGALGIASRFAPQVHLQNIGFAVPLLVGGFVLRQSAPVIAELAARATLQALVNTHG